MPLTHAVEDIVSQQTGYFEEEFFRDPAKIDGSNSESLSLTTRKDLTNRSYRVQMTMGNHECI